MITVSLAGGLGNQMFQYAAARRLALKHGTRVRLDVSWYRKRRVPDRPFELGAFSLEDVVLADRSNLAFRVRVSLQRALQESGEPAPFLYVEKDPSFSERVLDLPNGSMLVGYFQSEKYFADIRDRICAEFRPKDAALVERVMSQIKAYRQSGRALVSVHVRRGDYLDVRPDDGLVVPAARIATAMAHFPRAVFLIFSDDPAWCREHFLREGIHLSPFASAVEDAITTSSPTAASAGGGPG